MCGQVLATVDEARNLGVKLNNDSSESRHVHSLYDKGNSTLSFLYRNIGHCPARLGKKTAYFTLIRSSLDDAYAAPV